jgi:hypothetical protein
VFFADCDVNSYVDSDCDLYGDVYADCDIDGYVHTDRDIDGYVHADCDVDSYADPRTGCGSSTYCWRSWAGISQQSPDAQELESETNELKFNSTSWSQRGFLRFRAEPTPDAGRPRRAAARAFEAVGGLTRRLA